jgi:hypothetical protein
MVFYWVLDSSGKSEHQANSDRFNVGCFEGTVCFSTIYQVCLEAPCVWSYR